MTGDDRNFSFLSGEDQGLLSGFGKRGFHVAAVEDTAALEAIRTLVAGAAASHLGLDAPEDTEGFLNTVHDHVSVDGLNDLRLAIIQKIQQSPWFRPAYFALVRGALHTLVGNELAMQRSAGLSVQLPNDDSSLLALHADVWDGDSPFEVVAWLPLVNCFKTKSMYLMDLEKDRKAQEKLGEYKNESIEAFYDAFAADFEFIDIAYGKVLIFSQNLVHGNRVNEESESRWSLNCRFKSLLSPYGDMKPLGESFEPVLIRPATRLGMEYRLPGGFDDE